MCLNEFSEHISEIDDGYFFAALDQLKDAKRSGLLEIDEYDIRSSSSKCTRFVKYTVLEECMTHHSKKLKMGILSILIESERTSHFAVEELRLITKFLEHNMAEKMEFMPLIRKVFERVKVSCAFLRDKAKAQRAIIHREILKLDSDPTKIVSSHFFIQEISRIIEAYHGFINNVRGICVDRISGNISILSSEFLAYGCKFNACNNSLRILHDMEVLLSKDFQQCAWTSQQAHIVMRCMIKDSFKRNKKIAFDIIKMLDASLLELDDDDVGIYYMEDVFDLANSTKPTDVMTAVYLFRVCIISPCLSVQFNGERWRGVSTYDMKLLKMLLVLTCELKTVADMASKDVKKTVLRCSMYGHVACIRTLLEYCDFSKMEGPMTWRLRVYSVVVVCLQLAQAVLPTAKDDDIELWKSRNPRTRQRQTLSGELMTTKLARQCSLRTLTEISLLFGELMCKVPIGDECMRDGMPALDCDEVEEVGKCFVKILTGTKDLSTLRQSSNAFAEFCLRLLRMKKEHLRCMPNMWFHDIWKIRNEPYNRIPDDIPKPPPRSVRPTKEDLVKYLTRARDSIVDN